MKLNCTARRWEAYQLECDRRERARRRNEAWTASRKDLFAIIEEWGVAKRIESFYADAERSLSELNAEDRATVTERLRLARGMTAGLDALERLGSWKAPSEQPGWPSTPD